MCSCLKAYFERLTLKPWWRQVIATIKFALHFALVCLALFLGALAFVYFEENAVEQPTNANKTWESISGRYFHHLNEIQLEELKADIFRYTDELKANKEYRQSEVYRNDQRKAFGKWFYFVTIASTTIGYGDVVPVTDEGRILYMCFTIISIPLVITLIASCGIVMTAVNKKLFKLINDLLCKKRRLVSEELMSMFTILLLFTGYLATGVTATSYLETTWSWLDCVYYWFVTFTTVGFGDINISLEHQVNYVVVLVVYRMFGLALVAGIIDALAEWTDRRKKELKNKLEEKRKLLLEKTSKFILTATLSDGKTDKGTGNKDEEIKNESEDLQKKSDDNNTQDKSKVFNHVKPTLLEKSRVHPVESTE